MFILCCNILRVMVCVFYLHSVLQWNVATASCYRVRYCMWEGGGDLAQPGHRAQRVVWSCKLNSSTICRHIASHLSAISIMRAISTP